MKRQRYCKSGSYALNKDPLASASVESAGKNRNLDSCGFSLATIASKGDYILNVSVSVGKFYSITQSASALPVV